MKTIDANIYWLPDELFSDKELQEEFLECIPREYDTHAFCYTNDAGDEAIRIEKPLGCENLNYFRSDYKLKKQLKDMDEAGIETAVMKLPGCAEWLNLTLCRFFNDAAAKHAKESGGRLKALAVVPPFADEGCIKELDRCVNELGMTGVQMSAHYGNHYLDDEMFRGMMRHINELGIPVYVHHTPLPVDYKSIVEYNNLRRSFGRCEDQVTAIGRELFSGMFEELPNLKMVHSMLGGAYFAYKEMLMPRDSGGGRFSVNNANVRKWLESNIYFELSHAAPWGKDLLKCAVKVLGADHIIYGSSYPVKKVWLTEGAEVIENLDIDENQKQMILYDNAKKIYKL